MSDPTGNPAFDPYSQPADSTPYSPTAAIGYGWRTFWKKPGQLLVPMIVVLIVIAIASVIVQFITHGGFFGGDGFWRQLLGAGLGAFLMTLITQILLAGIYRGACLIIDGQGFSTGQLLEGYNKTQVVLASIFIAVATGIATIACLLPGILIGFLTSFTLFFIVDQQLEAAEAIAESVKMVWHHFGKVLLFAILAAIAWVIGFIVLIVGLLVAVPVIVLAAAYTYRRLQGMPAPA
jgi:uncharacterized membrane protein